MTRAGGRWGTAEGLVLVCHAGVAIARATAVRVLGLGFNSAARDHIGHGIVGPAAKDTAVGIVTIDEVLLRERRKVVCGERSYSLDVAGSRKRPAGARGALLTLYNIANITRT